MNGDKLRRLNSHTAKRVQESKSFQKLTLQGLEVSIIQQFGICVVMTEKINKVKGIVLLNVMLKPWAVFLVGVSCS